MLVCILLAVTVSALGKLRNWYFGGGGIIQKKPRFFLNGGILDGVLFYPNECTILIAVMNDR